MRVFLLRDAEDLEGDSVGALAGFEAIADVVRIPVGGDLDTNQRIEAAQGRPAVVAHRSTPSERAAPEQLPNPAVFLRSRHQHGRRGLWTT